MCTCREALLTDASGKVLGPTLAKPVHDCAYIELRNSFIRQAEQFADKQAAPGSAEWTEIFTRRMDELMKTSGGT